jgi:hypothetical protein
MTQALKGALLSGLVYPGLGQLVLKRYRRGAAFIVAASAGLTIIVLQAVQRAMQILAQFDPTREVPDTNRIMQLLHDSGTPKQSLIYHLALLLLVGGWLYSTVDGYIIGRQLDRAGQPGSKPF